MTADARLDLRLNAHDKEKITHAANLHGVPVATFVRLAALREADTLITEATAALPTKQAKHRFVTSLRGCATAHLSTDEIMQLTRGA